MLFPVASLEPGTLDEINRALIEWGHKMGPIERPNNAFWGHILRHEGRAVAVSTASTLIRDHVGGGLSHMVRDNAVELSRLCAIRPGLCRVMLRMWREFVLPAMPYRYAISYQDADLHSGNTYRFDGWTRSEEMSKSGTDSRSGKKGRRKWIWWWEVPRPDEFHYPLQDSINRAVLRVQNGQ